MESSSPVRERIEEDSQKKAKRTGNRINEKFNQIQNGVVSALKTGVREVRKVEGAVRDKFARLGEEGRDMAARIAATIQRKADRSAITEKAQTPGPMQQNIGKVGLAFAQVATGVAALPIRVVGEAIQHVDRAGKVNVGGVSLYPTCHAVSSVLRAGSWAVDKLPEKVKVAVDYVTRLGITREREARWEEIGLSEKRERPAGMEFLGPVPSVGDNIQQIVTGGVVGAVSKSVVNRIAKGLNKRPGIYDYDTMEIEPNHFVVKGSGVKAQGRGRVKVMRKDTVCSKPDVLTGEVPTGSSLLLAEQMARQHRSLPKGWDTKKINLNMIGELGVLPGGATALSLNRVVDLDPMRAFIRGLQGDVIVRHEGHIFEQGAFFKENGFRELSTPGSETIIWGRGNVSIESNVVKNITFVQADRVAKSDGRRVPGMMVFDSVEGNLPDLTQVKEWMNQMLPNQEAHLEIVSPTLEGKCYLRSAEGFDLKREKVMREKGGPSTSFIWQRVDSQGSPMGPPKSASAFAEHGDEILPPLTTQVSEAHHRILPDEVLAWGKLTPQVSGTYCRITDDIRLISLRRVKNVEAIKSIVTEFKQNSWNPGAVAIRFDDILNLTEEEITEVTAWLQQEGFTHEFLPSDFGRPSDEFMDVYDVWKYGDFSRCNPLKKITEAASFSVEISDSAVVTTVVPLQGHPELVWGRRNRLLREVSPLSADKKNYLIHVLEGGVVNRYLREAKKKGETTIEGPVPSIWDVKRERIGFGVPFIRGAVPVVPDMSHLSNAPWQRSVGITVKQFKDGSWKICVDDIHTRAGVMSPPSNKLVRKPVDRFVKVIQELGDVALELTEDGVAAYPNLLKKWESRGPVNITTSESVHAKEATPKLFRFESLGSEVKQKTESEEVSTLHYISFEHTDGTYSIEFFGKGDGKNIKLAAKKSGPTIRFNDPEEAARFGLNVSLEDLPLKRGAKERKQRVLRERTGLGVPFVRQTEASNSSSLFSFLSGSHLSTASAKQWVRVDISFNERGERETHIHGYTILKESDVKVRPFIRKVIKQVERDFGGGVLKISDDIAEHVNLNKWKSQGKVTSSTEFIKDGKEVFESEVFFKEGGRVNQMTPEETVRTLYMDVSETESLDLVVNLMGQSDASGDWNLSEGEILNPKFPSMKSASDYAEAFARARLAFPIPDMRHLSTAPCQQSVEMIVVRYVDGHSAIYVNGLWAKKGYSGSSINQLIEEPIDQLREILREEGPVSLAITSKIVKKMDPDFSDKWTNIGSDKIVFPELVQDGMVVTKGCRFVPKGEPAEINFSEKLTRSVVSLRILKLKDGTTQTEFVGKGEGSEMWAQAVEDEAPIIRFGSPLEALPFGTGVPMDILPLI